MIPIDRGEGGYTPIPENPVLELYADNLGGIPPHPH
jgi:hypothetical protein